MITHSLKLPMLTILFLWNNISMAAEQVAAKTLTTPPISTSALFETLLGLLLVLSLIAFLAWLLRRTGRFQMTTNGEMKIITSLALGPRERAVLLQVGEQQILVGVTSQSMQTLHVLEEKVSVKTSRPLSSGFAEKLQQMMQQRGQS